MSLRKGLRAVHVAGMLLAGCVGMPALAVADSSLSLGVLPSYSKGSYGGSGTTTITYVPVYLTYRADDLTLKLTVPYISLQGTGTLISDGRVLGRLDTGKKATAVSTNASGLGDVWVEALYRLHGRGDAPDLIPYAKIKFGTASRSDGLGTGENDYEAGTRVEWGVGSGMTPFVDVGYRVLGQPPGVTLNNIFTYSAGVIADLDRRNSVTGMFSGAQSAVPGQQGPADIIVNWHHALDATREVQAFFDKGLSDGSPDYAVGVGIEVRL